MFPIDIRGILDGRLGGKIYDAFSGFFGRDAAAAANIPYATGNE